MTSKLVQFIAEELGAAGHPLTAQQMRVLEESRKKAFGKAREEIKNAVRESLARDGISTTDIMRAAQDLTKETVNNTLKERRLEDLIDGRIKAVIASTLVTPPKGEITTMMKSVMEREMVNHIRQVIQKNVQISFNEAGHYTNGGSF